MKLKNAIVGTRVQMKNIGLRPTECSPRTGRQYGLIEENEGTIIGKPDVDNDVKVRFDDFTSTVSEYIDYLYVNVKHLRKVK